MAVNITLAAFLASATDVDCGSPGYGEVRAILEDHPATAGLDTYAADILTTALVGAVLADLHHPGDEIARADEVLERKRPTVAALRDALATLRAAIDH